MTTRNREAQLLEEALANYLKCKMHLKVKGVKKYLRIRSEKKSILYHERVTSCLSHSLPCSENALIADLHNAKCTYLNALFQTSFLPILNPVKVSLCPKGVPLEKDFH